MTEDNASTIHECKACMGRGFNPILWGTTWKPCDKCGGEGIISMTAEKSRKKKTPGPLCFDAVAVAVIFFLWSCSISALFMLGYAIGD